MTHCSARRPPVARAGFTSAWVRNRGRARGDAGQGEAETLDAKAEVPGLCRAG